MLTLCLSDRFNKNAAKLTAYFESVLDVVV